MTTNGKRTIDKSLHRLHGRCGAFALEAALTVPIFLLILLSLISAMISVQAEIRMKTAVNRTAAEISLLPPIIFSLIDEDQISIPIADLFGKAESKAQSGGTSNQNGSVMTGIAKFIKPELLEEIVNDAVFDLTSSVVFGRLVSERIRYWQSSLGDSALLSRPSVFLDWQLDDDQLYLEVYYEVRTLLGGYPRHYTALVPIWRPSQASQAKSEGQSVWKLDNFTRGKTLRAQYGGNLPSSYPVIARFSEGEALAIKSLDLNKPAYENSSEVYRRVAAQIKEVAAFPGTAKPFGKEQIWVRNADIRKRRMLLVVPVDSDFGKLNQTMVDLTRLASAQGVVFEVVSFGRSKVAES